MTKNLLVLTVLAATSFLAGCCSPPKIGGVTANWTPAQHTNTWCWAASTEMVSDFYGHRVNQCDSSHFVHNNPADCTKGCSGYCSCWNVCGATITQIKNNWTHWKFNYTYQTGHPTWNDLKKTLSSTSSCSRSPVQVIWWWTAGGGHVVTAYGYAETAVGNFVSYYNPWPPDCTGPATKCNSSTAGGEDAVATYEWVVSTPDKNWGDTFSKFSYAP